MVFKMPFALIQSGTTVIPPIFYSLPSWLTLPNGDQVSGLHEGVITSDGVYSILPAQYDTPPNNSQETGRSYSISDGAVQITRTWQTLPVYVPSQITNAQARYVLMQTPSPVNQGKTLFDDVNSAIIAAGGVDQMAWEYANTLSRDSSLVGTLSSSLGLTSAQVDSLFITAATITF